MSKKKLAALIGALGIMVSAYATPSMAINAIRSEGIATSVLTALV